MKKVIVALLCISVLFISYNFLVTPSPLPKENRNTSDSETKTSSNEETSTSIQYSFAKNQEHLYEFSYNTKVQMSKDSITAMKMSGTLYERVRDVQNDKLLLGYRVANAEVIFNQQGRIQDIENVMAKEVFVEKSLQGKILKWFFPRDIPAEMRNYHKNLLLTLQIVLPKENVTSWEIEEEDLNGKIRVEYSRKTEAEKDIISKSRKHYIGENKEVYQILESKVNATISQNRLKELQGTEQHLIQQSTKIDGELSYHFRLVKSQTWKPNSEDSTSKNPEEFYTTTESSGEGSENLDKERWLKILAGRTLGDFEKTLQELEKNDNPLDRYEVFRGLIALLETDPIQIDNIQQKLLSEQEFSLASSTILNALAKVSHPEAQNTLGKVIQDHENTEMKTMAIASIGGVAQPTLMNTELVEQMTKSPENEVKTTAVLALGSMAGTINQGGQKLGERFIFDLSQQLKSSEKPTEQLLYLEALGNTGASSSLTTIEQYTNNSSSEVKATAVYALRLIDSPEARNLLSQKFSDSEEQVRLAALDAASYQKPSLEMFSALQKTVVTESSVQARIKQGSVLWNMRKSFPQAKAIVEEMAKTDASEEVRNALQSMILVK